MESRKASIVGTTLGILTTLGTAGVGVWYSLTSAAESASSCGTIGDSIKAFASSSFNMSLAAPSFNTTIFYQGLPVPVTIPSLDYLINLDPASLFTNTTISLLKSAPDALNNLCYNQTLLQGLGYTFMATSTVALSAIAIRAYIKHRALQDRVKKIETEKVPESIEINDFPSLKL